MVEKNKKQKAIGPCVGGCRIFIATKDLTVQNEEEKPLSLRYVTGLRLFHRDLTGMMEINSLYNSIQTKLTSDSSLCFLSPETKQNSYEMSELLPNSATQKGSYAMGRNGAPPLAKDKRCVGREFVLTLRSVIWIDVIDLFLIISALFVAAKARAGRTVLCQYFANAWRFGFRFVWPTVCPVVLSAVWQLSQWHTSGPHRHPLRYLIVLDFSRLSAVKFSVGFLPVKKKRDVCRYVVGSVVVHQRRV
ncbi:hypothetical protein OUZ56_007467 [Daphnia magna]|uniref:Uncharacterized protein n=1 Tax=Daphnia magna TaxID=35525 RepID=A0ABR0AA15_9CRUS|nr:hypothetical protein OUZ56_007467 [Daphnia magna]